MLVRTSAGTATAAPPRHGRDFSLLWAGQSVSLLGDQVSILALPLAAAQDLHAGTMQVGLLGAATKVSFLLIGLPSRDRHHVYDPARPARPAEEGRTRSGPLEVRARRGQYGVIP